MTDRKYDPETTAKIEEIRTIVKAGKRRIPSDCLWFERVLRDHMQRTYIQRKTIIEREIKNTGREYQDFELEDLKESQRVLDGDILQMLDEEHAYVLKVISNKRITPYQVQVLHKAMQGQAGTSLPVWFDRLFGPSDGFITKHAPLVWWNFIKSLRNIPREPPPPVPSTFYLPMTHIDKTDREGLPYYFTMVSETATPDLGSTVSMTEHAVRARRRKYAGPQQTAEQYAAAEARNRKRYISRGEDWVKRKDEQRKAAHELDDQRRADTLHKFHRETDKAEKEQEKRREKNIKDFGDGT